MDCIKEVEVRAAEACDMAAVHAMIQELACFENQPNGPKLCVDDLIRDGGFNNCGSSHPKFHCFVAEAVYHDCVRKVIGYAITYFSYSTWVGRCLFLEDLYVQPFYRNKGVGKLLFQRVAEFAKENCCPRLELHVLNWNPAVHFYKRLGAIDLTLCEEWHYLRLTECEIERLTIVDLC